LDLNGSYEVVIIGGGPAGLTAGLYASRAGLKTMLLERGVFGGQIVNAQVVDNYPAFPEGIPGTKLGELMHQHAIKYGLESATTEVTGVSMRHPYQVSTTDGDIQARSIIIASGSEYSKLGVAGEEELMGRGVSYCATCDGFFFRNQEVAVVGGGDTAITDALELAEHCRKVYLIHRRDQLRATKALQAKAFSQPKMEFIWNTVVEKLEGDKKLNALRLRDVKTGEPSTLEVNGVFVAVGLSPNSQLFSNLVKLNEIGFVTTDVLMRTSTPGVFAAGDVRQNSARQVITAAGDGAVAASSAFKYLRE